MLIKKLLFVFTLFLASGLYAASPEKANDPCVIVIFGATGDLTARKIVPAIYNLSAEEHISENIAVVGVARREKSDDTFRKEMQKAIDAFSKTKASGNPAWESFEKKLFYKQADFDQDKGYEELSSYLRKIDQEYGTAGNRIYYLATQPSFFPVIIEKLHKHHLLNKQKGKWSKVIIEKPFGHDLDSALALQKHIAKYLDESQVYRMDHYLGKEGVQNLFAFRFENALFEPLWNNKYIESVQITISEDIGIGSRAHFWEETGLLRDIFQNHLMQLLTIAAMEPPRTFHANAIHRAKINLLNVIRPFPKGKIDKYVIRGQYDAGLVKGSAVPAYREENDVPKTSNIETFAAAKLFIDNRRWHGVPFYLRAGKRLPQQTAEIVVTFKGEAKNELYIRIQPKPGVFLKTMSKEPGFSENTKPVLFGYEMEERFGKSSPEAYEKLMYDCIRGDSSHFVRGDEQVAAWRLLTPVLNHWENTPPPNFPNYEAGTWGPTAAAELILDKWQLLEN